MPENLRFADPWVLVLLLVLPVLASRYRRRRPYRLPGGVVLSTLAPLAGIRPSWRVRLQPLPGALRLLALALVIVALARPQVVDAGARITAEGIDIVLALDISGSMRDAGLDAAHKIDAAKAALKQFLASRRDDRVGLVVFRAEARVLSPLTLDYKALAQLVEEADKNQPLEEGTAIGLGLVTSLNVLRDSHARSRVVILATDGENNVTTVEPEQAGKIAEALKVRVYTIGIPTAGTRAEQTLNEQQMRRIAEGTGGSYTRANNEQGLADLFTSIAALEKSRVERERFSRAHELAPWLLVPAFALVVLETLLTATVLRRAP
jgi:Ca-activated chloride channel family protein